MSRRHKTKTDIKNFNQTLSITRCRSLVLPCLRLEEHGASRVKRKLIVSLGINAFYATYNLIHTETNSLSLNRWYWWWSCYPSPMARSWKTTLFVFCRLWLHLQGEMRSRSRAGETHSSFIRLPWRQVDDSSTSRLQWRTFCVSLAKLCSRLARFIQTVHLIL